MDITSIMMNIRVIVRALGHASLLLLISHSRLMEVLEDFYLIMVIYFIILCFNINLASVKFGRFAFDNLYNLLVMIIMINIVSGNKSIIKKD